MGQSTIDTKLAQYIMKTLLIVCILVLAISSSQGLPGRQKRDLTCAGAGQKGCSFTCKARGWKDGTCTWITDTGREDVGQFKCECDKERRGIRCNLGGPNTCYYSCVALGYSNGMCDENRDNCNCGRKQSLGRSDPEHSRQALI